MSRKFKTDTYPHKTIEAHHGFPQQFEESFFLKRGVNIHEPQYLTCWEKTPHRSSANHYNQEWIRFMREHPEATPAEILQKGEEMMSRYGIETND